MQYDRKFDILGSACALVCGVHCALTPFIFTLGSIFFVEHNNIYHPAHNEMWESINVLFLALAVIFAVPALYKGIKLHGKKLSVMLFCVGFCILSLGCFKFTHDDFASVHVPLMMIGALFLISSHIFNILNSKKYLKAVESNDQLFGGNLKVQEFACNKC